MAVSFPRKHNLDGDRIEILKIQGEGNTLRTPHSYCRFASFDSFISGPMVFIHGIGVGLLPYLSLIGAITAKRYTQPLYETTTNSEKLWYQDFVFG